MYKEKITLKNSRNNNSQKVEITFILLSLIYFSDKKLSYADKRSTFTPLQRAKQTVRTVNSIRKFVPSARIIIVETGKEVHLPCKLIEICDEYIFLGHNFLVRMACDSKYKGLGEAVSLLFARKYLINKADYFFKISGRYYLTDKFNLSLWNKDKLTFRKYENDVSTRFYGFPNRFFNWWFLALLQSIPYLLLGQAIEHVLPKFIPSNKVKSINYLGVEGRIGTNNYLLCE